MIRVLVVADREAPYIELNCGFQKEKVDLILSCGDLPCKYLEYLVTLFNCPLLYVPGNHDEDYAQRTPQGCVNIDESVYCFKGFRILGLGGSMRYKNGLYMYSESEMRRRIQKLNRRLALRKGIDIVLTHAPVKGYGDLTDLPHQGYACFNDLIRKHRPLYFFHGHIHKEYGSFQRQCRHAAGTAIVNGYNYIVVDIERIKRPDRQRWIPKMLKCFRNHNQ